MTESKVTYGPVNTLTASIWGLPNGGWWQTAAVDNSSNLFIDVQVGGKLTVSITTTPVGVSIYAYGLRGDDGEYSGQAAGAAGSYTPVANTAGMQLRLLDVVAGSVTLSAQATLGYGPYSIAQAFGGVVPKKWGLIFQNQTGQNLDSTASGFDCNYWGVKFTDA
jgi:hypothetical protein